jgi:putative acetyltransferase
MGLAPLSVLPSYQGQGIGSELCRRGIRKIGALKYPFVVVLGNPGYYTRFGFSPAKQHNIACEYLDVPDNAFMIKVFDEEIMQDVIGTAYYRPEFGEIT